MGGMIVEDYIQTHGNGEGGDYASIGTGPDCCHGTSIVPQHMGMAQKPPVKMFTFWSVDAACLLFFFLGDSFDSLGCSMRSAAPYRGPISMARYLRGIVTD